MSCGCLRLEILTAQHVYNNRALIHGHIEGRYQSPTYQSWKAMKARCQNPNASNYGRYGGRGITVCDRWQVFELFLLDMGERLEDTTLDRIDPNGNYEPGNCRWADIIMQNNNRRERVYA